MGYNTTVVILNDGLHDIKEDPEIGAKLYNGVLEASSRNGVTVSAGNHCNPIKIVETHHADSVSLIAVGGNTAQIISPYICSSRQMFEENTKVEILKALAEQLGYRVIKKGEK